MNSGPWSLRITIGNGKRLVISPAPPLRPWPWASANPDEHAEVAVPVDHVQEPASAAISGGVELENHGPYLVSMPAFASGEWAAAGAPPARAVALACGSRSNPRTAPAIDHPADETLRYPVCPCRITTLRRQHSRLSGSPQGDQLSGHILTT